MEPLSNLLQQIISPEHFTPALKVLNQVTIPKLNNGIILLLRNVVRINNKATHQFDGLAIAVKIIKQSFNLDNNSYEWSSMGDNFYGLIIAIFDSFLLYRNTSVMKDIRFCNLILEAGKSILPIVNNVDCLRVSVNNGGYNSILQIIYLDELDFPIRKEIFLLFKPIIVKSDTRQRKIIMSSNDFFLSKMAAMVLNCGDFETQEAIVELLMRFSYSSKQKLNKILCWFREYPAVLTATKLLDYKSFDVSCRKFLNSVNRSINSNVVTLSCFEAFANEIKLQKPRLDGYEELWVDFSLKTGIIHITCESGANAWLRLLIDSKNVKNSFFSSRFLKENETEIKGKQILIELISPLEIEHHLKEALIVTITLVFVESSELDNIQKNFFDKWYDHLNKEEKKNQFLAVQKAFQENIQHRSKQKEKFFKVASISSLSSIHTCSTCSFRQCCHHKGKSRSPLSLKCNDRQTFLTSTPKNNNKCQKELPPPPIGGFGNISSCSNKYVKPNSTPSFSGGIFNHATLQKYPGATAKSSLVKGIFVEEDKKEDGLFKRMMEVCLKKEKDKENENINRSDAGKELNASKYVFPANAQPSVITGSNFDLKKLPQSTNKPLKLGISKYLGPEEDNSLNKVVSNAHKINANDYSEESEFVMASHGNKHNAMKVNQGTNEISHSSSSVISTSDETSTKSSRKGINLLNPEEKTMNSPQVFENIVNPDQNNLRTELHENIWNDKLSVTKKAVPYSPYLKLFNSKNSSMSSQSSQIQQDDLAHLNPEKSFSQKTKNTSSFLKLKPSTLNVGSLIKNELNPVSQNTFSFSPSENVNTFSNANEDLKNIPRCKSEQRNTKLTEFNHIRSLDFSNTSQNSGKANHSTEIEKTLRKRTTEAKTKTEDQVMVINEDEVNVANGKGTNENSFGADVKLKQSNYLNDSIMIRGRTNENKHKNIGKGDYSKNQVNYSFSIENKPFNVVSKGDLDKESLTQGSNLCDLNKKVSPHDKLNSDIETVGNGTRIKKKPLPKKRNSKGSSGAWDAISSGHNTTISSLPSIHCVAIPKKTYSTKPTVFRKPSSPEQTFEDLIKQKGEKNSGNVVTQKKVRPGRKRKLFTPNSSLEELSPFKSGEDSLRSSGMLFKDNPPEKTYKRKRKQNTMDENKKKKNMLSPQSLANVYNFTESPTSVDKQISERRKSLRSGAKKKYKELSSEESDVFQKEVVPKKKGVLKNKTPPAPLTLTLPDDRLSISEKVSRFVWSINEGREEADQLRQEDLESEMRLCEVPVEENKSDLSQLESVEPPIWLSSSDAGMPSLRGSSDSLNAPTELVIKGDPAKKYGEEMEFLESVIKNIECLSLSVKRKNPKINSQEKILKTIESFTSSGIEEINKKWEEARQSLELMISNLDNMSDSYKTFMASLETRMKDMIESSISDFNMDRSSSNSRSENLCKELKKMCHERHKLLKKQ